MLIAFGFQEIISLFNIKTVVNLFFYIGLQTAIPEELSKLLVLFMFIALSKRWKRLNPIETKSDGAAAGLVAALGFALFETAGYSISNLQITFLRAVTAAPVHAACGIRTGMSTVAFRMHQTGSGIRNLLLAILIHTAYNFFVINRGTGMIVLIVAVSVISSLMHIKGE